MKTTLISNIAKVQFVPSLYCWLNYFFKRKAVIYEFIFHSPGDVRPFKSDIGQIIEIVLMFYLSLLYRKLTVQFQVSLSQIWTELCTSCETGQFCMSWSNSVKSRGCAPLRHECGTGPPPQLRVR